MWIFAERPSLWRCITIVAFDPLNTAALQCRSEDVVMLVYNIKAMNVLQCATEWDGFWRLIFDLRLIFLFFQTAMSTQLYYPIHWITILPQHKKMKCVILARVPRHYSLTIHCRQNSTFRSEAKQLDFDRSHQRKIMVVRTKILEEYMNGPVETHIYNWKIEIKQSNHDKIMKFI